MEVSNGNIAIGNQYIRSKIPTDISTYKIEQISPINKMVLLSSNASRKSNWIYIEELEQDYTLIED